MTKAQAKRFIGKRVQLTWRDPISSSGWTGKPLGQETATCETLGVLQGSNVRGELVIASSWIHGGEVGDVTTLPLPCVEDIREIDFKLKRYRR